MKVGVKNNIRMRRLAIIGIILILFCFILEFNYPLFAALILYLTSFIPVILVWYLIAILQFAGEDIFIQTPFSIYLGISFISLLSQLFSIPGNSLLAIGVLSGILIIYIILATFKIKNKTLSNIYRAYSISLLLVVLLKVSVAFVIPLQFSLHFPFFANFITALDVLPLYIALRIVNTTGEILKAKNVQALNEQQAT